MKKILLLLIACQFSTALTLDQRADLVIKEYEGMGGMAIAALDGKCKTMFESVCNGAGRIYTPLDQKVCVKWAKQNEGFLDSFPAKCNYGKAR
jgi:hypothetical protein